ncbi:MAG: Spore coat protein CotH [Actinomycetota bacterium]|nr:Spore coat protein CotH [Actinomycetota bacterium]
MMAIFTLAWSGVGSPAQARQATADSTVAENRAEVMRDLEALGGAGSAGMDPARAQTLAQTQAENLTGDITFSVPSTTFQGQLSVRLSTSVDPAAQIRYTTNGSLPSASSTLYSGPLTLTLTTQLRAQAFVDDFPTGEMGTALYVARSVTSSNDLPLLVMDAYGGGKPGKEDYKDVAFMLMDRAAGSTASLAQTPTVATRAGFRLRGQSSSNNEKAPYRIELHDNRDKDADFPLVGMPEDSDWVLRGPFQDKALIRDAFAFSLGRDMGLQTPRFAFVEVYLNLDSQPMNSSDYQGVYLLMETAKISPDRIDIAKLKKADVAEPAISGGYHLQFNMGAAEPPTIPCTGGTTQVPCWKDLEIMEPKDPPSQQIQWITNYIKKTNEAIHSSNPSNATTGYPAYLDVASFTNYIIANELAREGDTYMRSTHLFKDRGGKLVAGPLWDYDLGYDALPAMMGGSSVQGWQYPGMGMGMGNVTDWFVKLMADTTFLNQVKDRWKTLRKGVLSEAQLTSRITTLTSALSNAAQRNFQKWPNLNTSRVGVFQTRTSQTWSEQVQFMRTFVSQRAAWLDSTSGWGGNNTGPVDPGNKGCTASLAKIDSWGEGFNSTVTVKAGNAAISTWTVVLQMTSPQTIQNSWNGTFSFDQNTRALTVKSNGNGNIAANASTTFGFITTTNGNSTTPTVTSCTAS